jgi:hypothetical protein
MECPTCPTWTRRASPPTVLNTTCRWPLRSQRILFHFFSWSYLSFNFFLFYSSLFFESLKAGICLIYITNFLPVNVLKGTVYIILFPLKQNFINKLLTQCIVSIYF